MKDITTKYPFLIMKDWKGKIIEESNWFDYVPKGWKEIFLNWCEIVLSEYLTWSNEDKLKFEISEIKEKFGALRIYYCGPTNELISVETWKLECDSEYTCIICGKKPQTKKNRIIWKSKGYILPYCKKCMMNLVYNKKYKKESFTKVIHKHEFYIKHQTQNETKRIRIL